MTQSQFERQAKVAGYQAEVAATVAEAGRMLDGK